MEAYSDPLLLQLVLLSLSAVQGFTKNVFAHYMMGNTIPSNVSVFIIDRWNWHLLRSKLIRISWLGLQGPSSPYGLFQWAFWPANDFPMLTDFDQIVLLDAGRMNKAYMAGVSPWFLTRFGASWNKNWIYKSETHPMANSLATDFLSQTTARRDNHLERVRRVPLCRIDCWSAPSRFR